MLEKLSSRKLWVTLGTILTQVLSQDMSDMTRMVMGATVVAYVLGQSYADAKATEVAKAVSDGIKKVEEASK